LYHLIFCQHRHVQFSHSWKMKIQVVPLSQQSWVQKHITPDSCDVSNNMLVSSVQKHCRLFYLFKTSYSAEWHYIWIFPCLSLQKAAGTTSRMQIVWMNIFSIQQWSFDIPLGCDSWFQPHSISTLFKTKMLEWQSMWLMSILLPIHSCGQNFMWDQCTSLQSERENVNRKVHWGQDHVPCKTPWLLQYPASTSQTTDKLHRPRFLHFISMRLQRNLIKPIWR
jgi:hypothetical protein